jgi:hypothetical protein
VPVTSTTTLPEPPYSQAPYLLDESWCIGDSVDVINANTVYFENNKVNRSGDTMTGSLTIHDDLIIDQGGKIDLSCGQLTNFGVDVKSINITPNTPNEEYVLSYEDCAKVIVVTSTVNCFIVVPEDLKLGFNIMVVSNTDFSVNIKGKGQVLVRNAARAQTISKRYGICNLIIIGTNAALISGDLS